MAAETRLIFDQERRTFDMRKKRVTDYGKNSRVILPKAQTSEQESKLEVIRMEVMEQHKQWVKKNCNCKGEQPLNLDLEEREGLKSCKTKLKNGIWMIVPTDKSGRFALMTVNTYILAGMVHTKGDTEIGLAELKSNQRKLNGHLSMLIKYFNTGQDWNHTDRFRESMMGDSLTV